MRGGSRSSRALAVLVLVPVAACGPPQRLRDPSPLPTVPPPAMSSPPAATAARSAPAVSSRPTTDGRFHFVLVGPGDRPVPGVPVSIGGRRTFQTLSDASGRVAVSGPAGDYTLAVQEGCTDALQIVQSFSARFGIAAGETGEQRITVRFVHRYAPFRPVFSNVGPSWPVGQPVDLRFTLADRCDGGRAAAGRAFPTWSVRTSPNVRVVAPPALRSDARGFDAVRISCTAAGQASVVLYDRDVPSDTFDLVEADAAWDRRPVCSNPQ